MFTFTLIFLRRINYAVSEQAVRDVIYKRINGAVVSRNKTSCFVWHKNKWHLFVEFHLCSFGCEW